MEFSQEITGGAALAAVDFEAAARALEAGVLPCCGGFSELKTVINIRWSRAVSRTRAGSR